MQCRHCFTALLFLFTFLAGHSQTGLPSVKSAALRLQLDSSYARTTRYLQETIPGITVKNLLLVDVTMEAGTDADGLPVYLDKADTSAKQIARLSLFRYRMLYRFNNTGLLFNISDIINEGISFDGSRTGQSLQLLEQLYKGECKGCVLQLQQYVKKHALPHYRVSVEIISSEAPDIADQFVWSLIKTDKTIKNHLHFFQGGSAVFVSPKTGQKVNMMQYFRPPSVKED